MRTKTKRRWDDYLLKSGRKHREFWIEYLKSPKDILYVMGVGFDPRMCVGIRSVLESGGGGMRDCMLIRFAEGPNSASGDLSPEVEKNEEEFRRTTEGRATLRERRIRMEDDDGHRTGSAESAAIFKSISELRGYTDIILDISSLPSGVYLPLLGKILSLLDGCRGGAPNLHVLATENPATDGSIRKSGLQDRASILHGFPGRLGTVADEDSTTVWIPVLGEGQQAQLERISDMVNPKEICPVIPSPSRNPRRGDDLLLEYRNVFTSHIEPRNVIYAAESNPFELYRQIQDAVDHYRKALKPLGNPRFVLSALSSKLMSIGVFLAAYETMSHGDDVGIVHVDATGYSWSKSETSHGDEVFSMWIYGECYRP